MFDRLLFKNEPDYGSLINVGALAESLLFYGHVELICNSATLEHLCRRIPPIVFLDLISSERITVYLLRDQLAVQTQQRDSKRPLHCLVKMSSHKPTFEESAERAIDRCTADNRVSRAIVKRLHPLGHETFDSRDAMSALLDHENTSRLVTAALTTLVPAGSLPASVEFALSRDGEGLVLATNLDLEELDRLYHLRVPITHSSINPAWLISLLQGAKESLHFAAMFRSQMANGRIEQSILSEELSLISQKLRADAAAKIQAFSNVAMQGHSVQEAINRDLVSFREFTKLLDRADKFKEWISTRPPGRDLLQEYYREVTAGTWIERLPGKTFRWLVFTGLGAAVDSQLGTGVAATASAQGLSAFDTFLLDRLIGGWRPSQFVEAEIMPLVTRSDPENTTN
jgi:hypothetical protein